MDVRVYDIILFPSQYKDKKLQTPRNNPLMINYCSTSSVL